MEHCSGNTRRRTSASSIGLSVSSLADTCLRLDRGRVGFRWSEPQFELSTPPSSVVRLSEAGCAGPPTSDANDRLCSGRGRKSVPNADDSRRTGSACSEWRRFNVRSGPPELSQPTLTPSPSRQPSGWILDRCQEPTNTPRHLRGCCGTSSRTTCRCRGSRIAGSARSRQRCRSGCA